jgi:hypothetical protein
VFSCLALVLLQGPVLSPGEISEVPVSLASVARTMSCHSGRAEVCVPSVAVSDTTSVAGTGSCPGGRAEVCAFARSRSTAVVGQCLEELVPVG